MKKPDESVSQLYNIYLDNPHPLWLKQILHRYHRNLTSYVLTLLPAKNIRLLEIGPGRGYFYEMLKKANKNIEYAAIDRNATIIKRLDASEKFEADATRMPIFPKKFDVIYASYIIEHLPSGLSLFEFLSKCKKNLSPGGLLIILTNNALKQGMEFWHADYTHAYPTTPRNVAMAIYDSGFKDVRIRELTDFSVWLTPHARYWPFLSHITRTLLFWYNHRIISALWSLFEKNDIYKINNVFFQFHIFTQHPNMVITASIK